MPKLFTRGVRRVARGHVMISGLVSPARTVSIWSEQFCPISADDLLWDYRASHRGHLQEGATAWDGHWDHSSGHGHGEMLGHVSPPWECFQFLCFPPVRCSKAAYGPKAWTLTSKKRVLIPHGHKITLNPWTNYLVSLSSSVKWYCCEGAQPHKGLSQMYSKCPINTNFLKCKFDFVSSLWNILQWLSHTFQPWVQIPWFSS